MDQNEIENMNPDIVDEPGKNKKLNHLWKILFLSVGSVAGVLLLIDITSGIIGGLYIISFLSLLIIPVLFAYPIIIRVSKLLVVPCVLVPVMIIITGVSAFFPGDQRFIILLFCVVSAVLGAFGIGAGLLIRLSRSKKGTGTSINSTSDKERGDKTYQDGRRWAFKGTRIKKIVFITIGCLILLTPMLFIMIQISGILLPNPPMPEITYAEFPFRIEIEHDGERLVFEDTIICEYDGFVIYGYLEGKYRSWNSRFASDREYLTNRPSIQMLNTDFVLITFHSADPAFYMDRPWYELEFGTPYSPSGPSIYVDDKEMRARGEHSFSYYSLPSQEDSLRETLANLGIEIISIELTPPIENTFK